MQLQTLLQSFGKDMCVILGAAGLYQAMVSAHVHERSAIVVEIVGELSNLEQRHGLTSLDLCLLCFPYAYNYLFVGSLWR